jgi:hypothetical protein
MFRVTPARHRTPYAQVRGAPHAAQCHIPGSREEGRRGAAFFAAPEIAQASCQWAQQKHLERAGNSNVTTHALAPSGRLNLGPFRGGAEPRSSKARGGKAQRRQRRVRPALFLSPTAETADH